MNEKKDITISLSTFFLIIAILIIGIMGVFIYNLNNEQKQANSKIEELNAEINNTQENVNNINTAVNETESVNEVNNSTEKDTKLDINSEQIQLLYKYIPAMNTNKIEVNAYQNKKVTKDSLSNKYLLGYAFSNLKLANSEKEKIDGMESDTEWYSFKASLLQNKAKQMYGTVIKNESFDIGYGEECNYANEKYTHSIGGTSAESLTNIRKIMTAYQENDTICIKDKYMVLIQKGEENTNILYKSSEQTDVIDSKVDVKQIMQQENESTIKQTSDNLVSKYQNNMKEYKHIFKKDANGNYYWYSTEPI